jgi:hypothetical protein
VRSHFFTQASVHVLTPHALALETVSQVNFLRTFGTLISGWCAIRGVITVASAPPQPPPTPPPPPSLIDPGPPPPPPEGGSYAAFAVTIVGVGLLVVVGAVLYALGQFGSCSGRPSTSRTDSLSLLRVQSRSRAVVTFALGLSVGLLLLLAGSELEGSTRDGSDLSGRSPSASDWWIWLSLAPYALFGLTYWGCTRVDPDSETASGLVLRASSACNCADFGRFLDGFIATSIVAVPCVLFRLQAIGAVALAMALLAHTAFALSVGGVLYWNYQLRTV